MGAGPGPGGQQAQGQQGQQAQGQQGQGQAGQGQDQGVRGRPQWLVGVIDQVGLVAGDDGLQHVQLVEVKTRRAASLPREEQQRTAKLQVGGIVD